MPHCYCDYLCAFPDSIPVKVVMIPISCWDLVLLSTLIKQNYILMEIYQLFLLNCDLVLLNFFPDWGTGVRGPSGGGSGNDEAGGAAKGGEGAAQLHPLGESTDSGLFAFWHCPRKSLLLQKKRMETPEVHWIFFFGNIFMFHPDHRELRSSGETDGGVWGVWSLPHRGWCTVPSGWPLDGQAAYGLRQDQVHRRRAEGNLIICHVFTRN